MIRRRVDWTLPVAIAAAVAAAIVVASFVRELDQGGDGIAAFERGGGVLAALGVVALSLLTRPAWPLSLGLALAVFSGHWSDLGMPVALDRVLLLSAIVSTVVREARTGSSSLRTEPIHWLLATVGLYALCSSILAGTLDDSAARFALVDRFGLLAFGLFYVAPIVYRDQRDRQLLLWVLVALGAYLGIDAIIETTGPRGLLFPRYIDDPSVGIHFDRARGPFAEAVGNGLVLYGCAVAAAIAALDTGSRRLRGVAVFVMALCLLGTLLTLTRAIWLGVIVATIMALSAAQGTRRFLAPAIAVGLLSVTLAFAAIPGFQEHARSRTNDQKPLWDRENSNAAALRMLSERPTIGFGWGRFAAESPPYYRQAADYPLTFLPNVHNVYLANAVELGAVGAALWLLALLAAIVGGVSRRGPPELRPWKLGLIGIAATYLIAAGTTPLAFTLPTLLLWTWAGIVRGPARTTS